MAHTKLIIGLGNPGAQYEQTRHNAGFLAVELFSRDFEGNWKNFENIAEVFKAGDILIVKPGQYMNNSGLAIKEVAGYYRIKPHELLAVVDDFSIPLGTIRLRRSGSDGGHNGLASIIENLNTSDFPRLRMGIGPVPERIDPADFVLSRFKKSELREVDIMLEKAVRVIGDVVDLGFEKAASKMSSVGEK